jgi:hypothetical protein
VTEPGREQACRLCDGTRLINECPQSCDGSHVEDLLWTCICTGASVPLPATAGDQMAPAGAPSDPTEDQRLRTQLSELNLEQEFRGQGRSWVEWDEERGEVVERSPEDDL